MTVLEEAQRDLDVKDRRFKIGAAVFIVYAIAMLTVLAVQTFIIQQTIAENQKKNAEASEQRFDRYTQANERQHQLTQEYIRCIASALLVPVSEREEGAFDRCGIKARQETTSAPLNQSAPIVTNPQPRTEQPAPSPVTVQPDPQPAETTPSLLDSIFDGADNVIRRIL